MISNNHYKVLGVNANEDAETIKIAFKRLASKYHPDKNHNNSEYTKLFYKIKNAYDEIMEYKNNG
jgi:molecular chaperone DnaJ